MSELLHHDDDAINPDGLNDIDVSRMVTNAKLNKDFTIGWSPEFQQHQGNTPRIRQYFQLQLQREGYVNTPHDFHSWSCREVPSRHISVEKHAVLVRPVSNTAIMGYGQIRKQTIRWRFTVDLRNLNNSYQQGGKIPNKKEIIERIDSIRPTRFAITDLTSGFFHMPLSEPCGRYTVFITFRGINEWTKFPRPPTFRVAWASTNSTDSYTVRCISTWFLDPTKTPFWIIHDLQLCREQCHASRLLVSTQYLSSVTTSVSICQKRTIVESTISFCQPNAERIATIHGCR